MPRATARMLLFYRGSPARVFTLTGQRCLGVVDQWSPQAMTIRMPDYFLRIRPSDVRKVDHNTPGFWPAAWRDRLSGPA